MKADLKINNALICTPEGLKYGGIASKNGKIIAIADDDSLPQANTVYDAKGLLLLPGVIEPHCHLGIDLNEDGSEKGIERYIEDMTTESKAAAVGGITTINTTVEGLGPGGVRFTGARNKVNNAWNAWKNSFCDIKYYLGVANDDEVKEFNQLRSEGILSCAKVFLGFRGKNAAVFGHPQAGYSNDFIYRACKSIKEQDGPGILMFHCEDAVLMDEIAPPIEQHKPVCGNYLAVWNRSRPGFLEAMDLCKTSYIANYTQCPIYIVHISAKETVAQLRWLQGQGHKVIGETCLHYLIFSCDDDICFDNPDWNNQAKVSPPIRGSADREALWTAIKDKTITCVGTDHTNYSAHANKLGTGDFWKARPGCGDGMSVLMAGIFSEGVNKRNMSIPDFCTLMSENPAKALGIYPQKGSIQIGSDCDVVVFDPNLEWTFDSEKTYSTHVGSIYNGKSFKGRATATFVRGELVAEKGSVVATKPMGQYVKNSLVNT